MFSIDFNSDILGQPASPGLYAHADPKEHIKFYCELGANGIQTFCVGLNGFAWYKSKIAPVTPGMKGDFLKKMISLGHQKGLSVHGYFCLAGNAYYRFINKEETSNIDWRKNIPLTNKYLDYFCKMVEEAVRENELDGILIDWFIEIEPVWIPVEKVMFEELMGEKFPEDKILDEKTILEFRKRAILRAWRKISQAIKSIKPECLIWINVPFIEPEEPLWVGNPVLKEVDMILTERNDLNIARWLRKETGGKPVLVNFGGLSTYKRESWKDIKKEGFHLFGYCRADPVTTLPNIDREPRLAGIREAFLNF